MFDFDVVTGPMPDPRAARLEKPALQPERPEPAAGADGAAQRGDRDASKPGASPLQ